MNTHCFLRQIFEEKYIMIFMIVALWYTCQRNSKGTCGKSIVKEEHGYVLF
jgi:hypothetical protein